LELSLVYLREALPLLLLLLPLTLLLLLLSLLLLQLLQGDSVSTTTAHGPVHSAVCGAGWERRRHRKTSILTQNNNNSSNSNSGSTSKRRGTYKPGSSGAHAVPAAAPVTFAAVVCELMR
jgi:hypothetical protein